MRYFDENLKEIFFYEIEYGSEFDGYTITYWSYEKVTFEDFQKAREEHKTIQKKYYEEHQSIRSLITENTSKVNKICPKIDKRAKSKVQKAQLKKAEDIVKQYENENKKLCEKLSSLKYPVNYQDYIIEKFKLQDIDIL